MANTQLGIGSFASGMASGMQMGMNIDKMRAEADQAKSATAKNQATASTDASGGASQPGAMGLPTSYQSYGQPAATGAAAAETPAVAGTSQTITQGAEPWSFIRSLFGGN